ncbi:MAG: TlpA disulfide reductase family protein [Bacteroidales bacterium]|nr:TlpA disulfide reductase family protein [Bacteroidales bacterium]
MKRIQYILLVATATILFTCCSKERNVAITGNVNNATSQMLYFEHVGDNGLEIIDSIKLKENGKFRFKTPRVNYPDFYRIRLNNKAITLGIDSCEQIILTCQADDFDYNYTIEGSESSKKIQTLKCSSRDVFKQLADTTTMKTLEQADSIIEAHRTLAKQIIIENTASSAAYYAVAQTINGHYYFSIDDKNDRKMWAAVATAHKVHYPDCQRTKRLEEAVISSMQNNLNAELPIPDEQLGAINLSLPNRAGENISLNSLRGKIVLLDFFAYRIDGAIAYLRFLNHLYKTYHDKGLEIYQVSLDEDKLFWAEQSREMPWISVRDNDAPYCKAILTYNIKSIPTSFLIDRNGDIVGRFGADTLEEEIEKLLK